MLAVIATLYQVIDGEHRAKCKISFPLTEDERISHFIHVREDNDEWLSVSTSVQFDTQPPAAVLRTKLRPLDDRY